MIHSFGKNENITNFVNMWMLENSIKNPTTELCGPFQLYFCENLFFLTKTATYTVPKLTNTALETLLNELFKLNPQNNEQTINKHINNDK